MKLSGRLFVFHLLFVSLFTGCDKPEKYDPEEVLTTIDTENWNHGYQGFVIIENKESVPIFSELTRGQEFILKRGDKITGDQVNLHLLNILKNPQNEVISWTLYSFIGIYPGTDVDLYSVFNPGLVISSSSLKRIGNIVFTEIPPFEIVTRSANNQRHCHTQNILQVPCAQPGYDSYISGTCFYVCLQQGEEAGYKLVDIPDEPLAEYAISLGGLNDDMSGYIILKDPLNQTDIDITAHGSKGSIEIFALRDQTIFPDNDVEVFVPDGLPQMSSFTTTYVRTPSAERMQKSIYRSGSIATGPSYLDAGLMVNHIPGNMPSISHNNDGFTQLLTEISFNNQIGEWKIVHPDAGGLYIPELPDEVLNAISTGFSLSSQLSDVGIVRVTAIEDSRWQDYNDSVQQTLNPGSYPEDDYTRLSDRKL
ncbi:MAG: hypothetical protein JXB19_00410 [Bacteroidales bacterium]|nr:hypothetical protein [Bacteroidales bacterium]